MKPTTRILITIVVLLTAGLLLSNVLMKKEYDKVDKSDTYWTYQKVDEQPFKYLVVEGGNLTKIAYEQSAHCSVRVLNEWQRYHPELIKTVVKDDTLFIKFVYSPKDRGEKMWMGWTTLVRVFSPELVYVGGNNTKIEMFKLNQKSIAIDMSGKSNFEIESIIRNMDSISVTQKDSSEVVVEMSPEYKAPEKINISRGKAEIKGNGDIDIKEQDEKIKSSETIYIQSVKASVHGYALLDIGHAQVNNLQLQIDDSSGIILSGGALKKLPK